MSKVKWGVIGAGGIADRRTIPGMMLACNAQLTAIMEINMEFAERISTKYGAKKAYDNIEGILADPDVEAVYIASPVAFHREQAIKAAMAGKHVLLEKPIALYSRGGQEIIEVCRKNGVLAASGLVMRYNAYHRKMKEIVEEGKIGQIVSCRAQLTCWYPEISGAWRQKKALSGGGALMDMGIHCVDLIRYVTGSKAKKIAGMANTKTFLYEVEDSGSILFETENGAFCYVESNFNIPDIAARCRFEVYGTKGSMLAEGTIGQTEGGKLELTRADDNTSYDANQIRTSMLVEEVQAEIGNIYTKEIESFGNSILFGKPVEVPLEDALHAQTVVEAAYQSALGHEFVVIN